MNPDCDGTASGLKLEHLIHASTLSQGTLQQIEMRPTILAIILR
jgi:hypothetical protein